MQSVEKILENTQFQSIIDIFEHSIEPILITDANWNKGLKIVYANREFCRITGYVIEELIGKNPNIFRGEESNFAIFNELKSELLKGNHFVGQSVNYKKDKSSYIVKWSISPLKDQNKNVIGYISFQKTIERVIQLEHEKLLNSIVNTSKNLILVTDLEGYIIYVNDACNQKLGYLKKELIGKHSRVLKSGMQTEKFYKTMWNNILEYGTFSDTFISKKKDGTLFYDKKTITTIRDSEGSPIYYVSTSTDITKQVNLQKKLESQVYIDALTQIYNKKKYEEMIEKQISNTREFNKVFSLILIDIDHFKMINDTFGHEVGDEILIQFSKVIQDNIRNDDLLFRWGGEEFVIITQKNKENAHKLAEKLRKLIVNEKFTTGQVTASFGIAEMSQKIDKNSIFTNADKALYEAKKNGRNQVRIF